MRKLLIRGGRLVDPDTRVDERLDLLIVDGVVAERGLDLEPDERADDRVEAERALVVVDGVADPTGTGHCRLGGAAEVGVSEVVVEVVASVAALENGLVRMDGFRILACLIALVSLLEDLLLAQKRAGQKVTLTERTWSSTAAIWWLLLSTEATNRAGCRKRP